MADLTLPAGGLAAAAAPACRAAGGWSQEGPSGMTSRWLSGPVVDQRQGGSGALPAAALSPAPGRWDMGWPMLLRWSKVWERRMSVGSGWSGSADRRAVGLAE